MTNEQIQQQFNELGFNNLGNKAVSDKILNFILQVRMDTINEIRKEVESKREEILANDEEMHSMISSTRNMKEWEEYGIRGQNQLKDNLIRMSILEDIKTFLDKIN